MREPTTAEIDAVRPTVTANLPGYVVRNVDFLGEGFDNRAYLVNDELVVRFSKEDDLAVRANDIQREAELLTILAGQTTVPIPAVRFAQPAAGCLSYQKLRGVALIDVPLPQRHAYAAAIGQAIGELLTALHRLPQDRLAELLPRDAEPPTRWRNEAREIYDAVRVHLPTAYHAVIKRFLATEPPPAAQSLMFSHNDLSIEHILVDTDGSITGIIDWSDAAIVDPAVDFGRIFRDLGPPALRSALGAYPTHLGMTELRYRAEYFARCSVFEDLEYGFTNNLPAYVERCLAALPWLFPVDVTN